MRGIEFKIPNLYGSFISEILNGIYVEQYIWKISEDEIYIKYDKSLFLTDVLNGQDFKDAIYCPSYYAIFANLQAYPNDSNIYELNTYEDFLQSDCKIIILITDNIFVDIYAKDELIINKIKDNAERCDFKDIGYITDENDNRTELGAI